MRHGFQHEDGRNSCSCLGRCRAQRFKLIILQVTFFRQSCFVNSFSYINAKLKGVECAPQLIVYSYLIYFVRLTVNVLSPNLEFLEIVLFFEGKTVNIGTEWWHNKSRNGWVMAKLPYLRNYCPCTKRFHDHTFNSFSKTIYLILYRHKKVYKYIMKPALIKKVKMVVKATIL